MSDPHIEVLLPADGPWTHAGCRLIDAVLDREHRFEARAIAREGLEAAEFEMSLEPDPMTEEPNPDIERIKLRRRLRCEVEIGRRLHAFCVERSRRYEQLVGEMACYSLALVNWREVGGAWLCRFHNEAAGSADTKEEKA